MGTELQLTSRPSRWTDRHQKLAEELTSWITNPDLRTATINQVLEYFKNEKKVIGDLERWIKRAIQNAFFRKQIWGKAWTSEHDQFMEWCATWIPDADIRRQVICCVREKFLIGKVPEIQPKKPSFWIRRIMNPAFRRECKKRGIPLANKWTEEHTIRARELAVKQGIHEDRRDSVVSRVWHQFSIAVEPIENLEHWMNNVISTHDASDISEMTEDSGGGKWPILTQVEGSKKYVDDAVRAQHEAEQRKTRFLEEQEMMFKGETGPLSPPPAPENDLFFEKLFQEHEKRSGLLGKLSKLVMDLCRAEVGYTASELGEHFQVPEMEIETFIEHDIAELALIAREEFGIKRKS